MKWVTLFSMSGSEICNVSEQLGRFPDLVITNKHTFENIDTRLLDHMNNKQLVVVPNKPTTQEYMTALDIIGASPLDSLITLHGYLRVIPPDICNMYNIINGHPGLITTYPELKGKDPQARAVHHPIIGSVIHQVTAGVDEGPVINAVSCDNIYHTIHGVTQQLKQLSQKLWVEFLSTRL